VKEVGSGCGCVCGYTSWIGYMDEIDVGMLGLDRIMERGVVEVKMGVGLEWLSVDVEEL
jgi:hypothetical protein